jgi:hypothetical protein
VNHLENPKANFEYLHITKYCVARAAVLALKGEVLDQTDLHATLSKDQVQFAGIYRKHLIRAIRNFLEKHNIANLPECEIHEIDPLHGPGQLEHNRLLILCVIQTAELDYLNTLNFLSLAPDPDEEIFHFSAGYWGRGAEMSKAADVPVLVTFHETGYYIKPCKDDAKRMTRSRRRMQKISVIRQEAFAFEKKEKPKHEPVASKKVTAASSSAAPDSMVNKTTNLDSRPLVKVIGDFKAIILPNAQKAISLSRKYKMRPFLRFIHSWVTERGTYDFYIEEVRDEFNMQFTGGLLKRGWRSDRFQDDLFKDNKEEFSQLFETIDKVTGHYRLKVCFQTADTPQRRR